MDSILVACYSYTGISRRAAEALCARHGWPLGVIRDARPRSGGSGYLRCVLDSLLRRHPPVDYDGPDPADFRTVVLAAPIWAGRLAGPMRSFVAAHRGSLPRVAVLTTMGSGGASNAVAEVARLLGHAPIAAAALSAKDFAGGNWTDRLDAFGEELVPASTATQRHLEPAWHADPPRPLEQP